MEQIQFLVTTNYTLLFHSSPTEEKKWLKIWEKANFGTFSRNDFHSGTSRYRMNKKRLGRWNETTVACSLASVTLVVSFMNGLLSDGLFFPGLNSLQAVAGGQSEPGTRLPSETSMVVAVLSSLQNNPIKEWTSRHHLCFHEHHISEIYVQTKFASVSIVWCEVHVTVNSISLRRMEVQNILP